MKLSSVLISTICLLAMASAVALGQVRKVVVPLVVEEGAEGVFEDQRFLAPGAIRVARLQADAGGEETATVTLSAWNGEDRGLMPLYAASAVATTGTATLSAFEGGWTAGETRVGLELDEAAGGARSFLLLLIVE